jgi:hypothetical protein
VIYRAEALGNDALGVMNHAPTSCHKFVGRAFMPAMLIGLDCVFCWFVGLRASAGMNARPTVHYL